MMTPGTATPTGAKAMAMATPTPGKKKFFSVVVFCFS